MYIKCNLEYHMYSHIMYFLSLLMLVALASAQPPSRTDAAWAFNGLCLRGAGIPAYDAFMHAAVAAFMVIDPSTIMFMLVMEPSLTTGRLHWKGPRLERLPRG